jgi:BirA family biotin operon repressor/biotin-[acetyl-CoA-carboxylase] ligase
MSNAGRELLDAAEIRRHLVSVDSPWRRLDVVEETGSTNGDLLARAAAGEDIGGAVLLAEYQNAGRGRHGRVWSAPPRSQISLSIWVSTVGVPSDGWGWLPLLTGVAVVDAVEAVTGIRAGLKWPNDVLVRGHKLAGILAEVAAPAPFIVIGMGLNVTMTADEVPDTAATSLLILGSHSTDRTALVRSILGSLAERLQRWRSAAGPDDALIADYGRQSLTFGGRVSASLPGNRQVVGVALAVDELGRLRIDTGDGVVTVSAGDITHLRPVAP